MQLQNLVKMVVLLFCLQSCGQKNTSVETYTYKTDKRTIYGMDLTVPGPFELYINGIRARKDYSTGMHNTFIDVNPYVLKSGTYTFRLKVFPEPSDLEKGGIQPKTLDFLQVALASYEKTGDIRQSKTYAIIKEFPVQKIDTPIPFYEITGEFTVELPYDLEGWSNGQDLSKLDQKDLEKKVVAFYEKMRNYLNNGDVEAFLNHDIQRTKETYIFNYTSKENIEKFETENIESLSECKGNMAPIEDFTMFVYGNNNQIVTLERNFKNELYDVEGNILGMNALIEKGEYGGYAEYSILLYLPKDSDEFVIIRK